MKPISLTLILGLLVLLVLAPGCMTHEERGEPTPVQTGSTDLVFLTENYLYNVKFQIDSVEIK